MPFCHLSGENGSCALLILGEFTFGSTSVFPRAVVMRMLNNVLPLSRFAANIKVWMSLLWTFTPDLDTGPGEALGDDLGGTAPVGFELVDGAGNEADVEGQVSLGEVEG